jgi:hypothetical protein
VLLQHPLQAGAEGGQSSGERITITATRTLTLSSTLVLRLALALRRLGTIAPIAAVAARALLAALALLAVAISVVGRILTTIAWLTATRPVRIVIVAHRYSPFRVIRRSSAAARSWRGRRPPTT